MDLRDSRPILVILASIILHMDLEIRTLTMDGFYKLLLHYKVITVFRVIKLMTIKKL